MGNQDHVPIPFGLSEVEALGLSGGEDTSLRSVDPSTSLRANGYS